MSLTRKKQFAVGEDITVSPLVEAGGKIRIRSAEAAEVARWFGLGSAGNTGRTRRRKRRGTQQAEATREIDLALCGGTITLITGASGAGKSSLLRKLRERCAPTSRDWIDLSEVQFADVPIVNCFGGEKLIEVLRRLGRVGLGEAWSYLRTPSELSDGQRFRLKLAVALHRVANSRGNGPILACDEFAAVLDRVTAFVVARCLRRAIDCAPAVAAVVATSHEDLVEALQPDVIVRCDFGRMEKIEPRMDTNGLE